VSLRPVTFFISPDYYGVMARERKIKGKQVTGKGSQYFPVRIQSKILQILVVNKPDGFDLLKSRFDYKYR